MCMDEPKTPVSRAIEHVAPDFAVPRTRTLSNNRNTGTMRRFMNRLTGAVSRRSVNSLDDSNQASHALETTEHSVVEITEITKDPKSTPTESYDSVTLKTSKQSLETDCNIPTTPSTKLSFFQKMIKSRRKLETTIDDTGHTLLEDNFLDNPSSRSPSSSSGDLSCATPSPVPPPQPTDDEEQRRRRRRRRRIERRKRNRKNAREEKEKGMAQVRGYMRAAAGLVALLCFGWYMFYMSTFATVWGMAFFEKLQAKFNMDLTAKHSSALLFLCAPLLLCATLTHILHRPPTSLHERGRLSFTPLRLPNLLHYLNIFRHKTHRGDGDPNYTFLAFLILIVPTCLYGGHRLYSHLLATDRIVHKHIANDFGLLSMMAMSWFLIPVSRHSTLLSAMGWDPIHAAQLHTGAGYVAVFGGLVHAAYYAVIYVKIDKIGFWAQVLPERKCWTMDVLFDSQNEEHDCYMAFMNLTGLFSATCFFILTCTSLWWVRRHYYKFFYLTHIIFGTSVFLGLAMHWNAMITYMCPSIIYYLASFGPYAMEAFRNHWKGGTRLVNVHHIPDSGGCVEMSFEMGKATGWNAGRTALRIAATQYVRIHVPDVSPLWHPFTVFSTPTGDILGEEETLNICFRQYGSFTTGLAKKLERRPRRRPAILVDGFYGGADRMTQALRHDTVVMVAGGIGIVSYIAMVRLLHLTLMVEGKDRGGGVRVGPKFPTKKVVLLWVCRDEGLIDHLCKTQFDRLVRRDEEGRVTEGVIDMGESGVKLHILIFHSRRAAVPMEVAEITPCTALHSEECVAESALNARPRISRSVARGEPFEPSPPSTAGKSLGIAEGIISSLVFATIAWGGLYLVWNNYNNVQQHHSAIANRMYSTLEILSLSLLAPVVGMGVVKVWNGGKGLWRRVRRHRYYSVMPTEEIVVGVGVRAPEDVVIPETAQRSTSREPIEIDNVGYDSLELVEANVKDELDRTEFVDLSEEEGNGSSSGNTSVSSATPLDVSSQKLVSLTASERTSDLSEEVSTASNELTSGVVIDHRRGRPDMEELFDELFEDTSKPGIFMCGPDLLLNAVKDAVLRRRCGGVCDKREGRSMRPRCAIYEEGFET